MVFLRRYWGFLLIIALLLLLIIALVISSIDRSVSAMYDDLSLHSQNLMIKELQLLIRHDWLGIEKVEALAKMAHIIENNPESMLFIKEASETQISFANLHFCFDDNKLVAVVDHWECLAR